MRAPYEFHHRDLKKQISPQWINEAKIYVDYPLTFPIKSFLWIQSCPCSYKPLCILSVCSFWVISFLFFSSSYKKNPACFCEWKTRRLEIIFIFVCACVCVYIASWLVVPFLYINNWLLVHFLIRAGIACAVNQLLHQTKLCTRSTTEHFFYNFLFFLGAESFFCLYLSSIMLLSPFVRI